MMPILARQQGATLIELLVSVVIGLIIAASMIGVYVNSTANSSQILKSSKLNQELTSLMTVMVNDIRRAGYAGDLLGSVAENKFTYYRDDTTEIINVIRVVNNSCILYAYNTEGLSEEGAVPTNDDIRGFRLKNGAVEMLRLTNINTNSQVKNSYCAIDPNKEIGEEDKDGDDVPDWLPLTDPDTTRIVVLNFSMSGDNLSSCLNLSIITDDPTACGTDHTDPDDDCFCNDYYKKYLNGDSTTGVTPGDDEIIYINNQIGIELSGELVSDNTISLTIGDVTQPVYVRLRNDILWEGSLPAVPAL